MVCLYVSVYVCAYVCVKIFYHSLCISTKSLKTKIVNLLFFVLAIRNPKILVINDKLV